MQARLGDRLAYDLYYSKGEIVGYISIIYRSTNNNIQYQSNNFGTDKNTYIPYTRFYVLSNNHYIHPQYFCPLRDSPQCTINVANQILDSSEWLILYILLSGIVLFNI